jgi:hypothetical protein
MNLNLNELISIFEKINGKPSEFNEQDAAPAAPASGGGGGKVPPKWADTVGGPKRGKANMLGKGGEKWETGLSRGVANQIY